MEKTPTQQQINEFRQWLHNRYCESLSPKQFTKEESDAVELDRR